MPLDTNTERTEVFYGEENTMDVVLHFTSRAKDKIDACIDNTRPLLAIEIKELRKSFIDAKTRGVRLRYVTEITKENICYCKELIKIIDELRHIDGIRGNFYISETEYIAPATLHDKGKPASQIIYSNVKEIIEHQKYVFDSFWNRAMPAEHRIREIEEGIIPNIIEIIQDPARAQEIYLNIVNDAAEEILLLFPTTNAFVRQDKIGALQLTEKAAEERNVKVRILMPLLDSLTEHTVRNLREEKKQQQPQKDNPKSNIDTRYIEQISEAKATILIVDKKISLVMEIRDDSKTTFYEAIGLSTYSNSKAGVLSYVSIFENLWTQTELYQQVRETNKRLEEANEQLKIHDKMQKEFIDIAAHELRTPIQPILGLTEVISSRIKDTEEAELLKVVRRNAKRLQQLTEDVLDVTRIESNSLLLNKEQFDLNEVITNGINDVIANTRTFSVKKKENIKLLYKPINKTIIVEADKARISQVISNLLNNAVKFTPEEEGRTISVILEENKNDHNNNKTEVIVKIKDTGIGIASEMMPRLFTKFATKSEKGGTGLGLFISKSIVEAHGGKMWAENNSDYKGATFYFSLPVSSR
ncbi:MAG TPA: HAMP domain-containing sensor histidine kinase [Nitrososphaeraceae archaeon]|nr:HAMP domain-containing sensor histidine kinase [Nitrososphaeraceae archaeon]